MLLTPEQERELVSAVLTVVKILGSVCGQNDSSHLVDQSESLLGPRRHINAVKRRIRLGKPGASKVGRRYLLTREALTEELKQGEKPSKPAAKPISVADDLQAAIRRAS